MNPIHFTVDPGRKTIQGGVHKQGQYPQVNLSTSLKARVAGIKMRVNREQEQDNFFLKKKDI
jgi:hypothetical protein